MLKRVLDYFDKLIEKPILAVKGSAFGIFFDAA